VTGSSDAPVPGKKTGQNKKQAKMATARQHNTGLQDWHKKKTQNHSGSRNKQHSKQWQPQITNPKYVITTE